MNTYPLNESAIMIHGTGVGTISAEMIRDRAFELAVIDGRAHEETSQAIALYRKLIKACGDDDCVTHDLAVKILADEEGHRTLFEGFLKSLKKDRKG